MDAELGWGLGLMKLKGARINLLKRESELSVFLRGGLRVTLLKLPRPSH